MSCMARSTGRHFWEGNCTSGKNLSVGVCLYVDVLMESIYKQSINNLTGMLVTYSSNGHRIYYPVKPAGGPRKVDEPVLPIAFP